MDNFNIDEYELDLNGEPLLSKIYGGVKIQLPTSAQNEINDKYNIYNQMQFADLETLFGDSLQDLSKHGFANSSSILDHLIKSNNIARINRTLSLVLQKHNIPVIFNNLPLGKPTAIHQRNGQSVISIDPLQIRNLSVADASTLLMHEIIHALTVDAINNPKTTFER
jgi:hypothetical protein